MNWDAISAISEAVGVIAVVISLLYLAFQIRFARTCGGRTHLELLDLSGYVKTSLRW